MILNDDADDDGRDDYDDDDDDDDEAADSTMIATQMTRSQIASVMPVGFRLRPASRHPQSVRLILFPSLYRLATRTYIQFAFRYPPAAYLCPGAQNARRFSFRFPIPSSRILWLGRRKSPPTICVYGHPPEKWHPLDK